MSNWIVVAAYRLQDKPKAIEHRDQLRAEGQNAFLTMELGEFRTGGQVLVNVAPNRKDGRNDVGA